MLTTVLKMPPSVPAASNTSTSENFIRCQDRAVACAPHPWTPPAGVIPIASSQHFFTRGPASVTWPPPTQLTAVTTAARANVLGGFTAGKGYCDDAAYSPRAWLIHQTRITKGAATAHTAWVSRARDRKSTRLNSS